MTINKHPLIKDLLLIEPNIHGDDRGYFLETFRHDQLEKALGHRIQFCQDNESRSSKGVVRGLHYQLGESAQSKLVRVVHGTVLDVAVDIRKWSPTFGQHAAVMLSGERKNQLFIPKGFAHGFAVLSEEAVFSYKVDAYFDPKADRGIRFDDALLNIDWKLSEEEQKLSSKDTNQPLFEDAELFEEPLLFYSPLHVAA